MKKNDTIDCFYIVIAFDNFIVETIPMKNKLFYSKKNFALFLYFYFSFHFVCLLAKFALANFFCKKKGKKKHANHVETDRVTDTSRKESYLLLLLPFFLYKNHHYQSYPSLNF